MSPRFTFSRPHLYFWGLFLLLHLLLFFPSYLALYQIYGAVPDTTISAGTWTGRVGMLFQRHSLEFFMLSVEFIFGLTLLFFLTKNNRYQRIISIFLYIGFFLLFFYNIYYQFYQTLYGETPSFINDWVLIKEVLPIFLGGLKMNSTSYILFGIGGFILILLIFIFLLRKLLKNFRKIRHQRLTQGLFAGIWLIILFNAVLPRLNPWIGNALMTPRILQSMSLKSAHKYYYIKNDTRYDTFDEYKLEKKPNVYLIFVESYGTVASESPELKPAYQQLVDSLDQELQEDGWHTASSYSVSPIKGGRSWLAFTSAMSGLKIENQVQYNDLVKINHGFPNLPSYFSNQGYDTYRLSTMTNVNTDSLIPSKLINNFWNFDEWIMYSDIPYQGYEFDYLGGLPDQYSLGYFQEKYSQADSPLFLFFITMTSHGPWHKPPPILPSWRDLDTIQSETAPDMSGETIDRYAASINYELEVITQFIRDQADPNSIFILLGDHQPPTLEYKIWDYTDDAATPLHVISQDSAFIASFQDYGLQPGWKVDLENLKYLQHQGLYSLLVRQLSRFYSAPTDSLPTYYPNGLE